jgi:hypothetical protein
MRALTVGRLLLLNGCVCWTAQLEAQAHIHSLATLETMAYGDAAAFLVPAEPHVALVTAATVPRTNAPDTAIG